MRGPRGEHRGAYRAFVGAAAVLTAAVLGLVITTVVYLNAVEAVERGPGRATPAALAARAARQQQERVENAAAAGVVLAVVGAAALVVTGVTYRGFGEERLARYHRRTRRLARGARGGVGGPAGRSSALNK